MSTGAAGKYPHDWWPEGSTDGMLEHGGQLYAGDPKKNLYAYALAGLNAQFFQHKLVVLAAARYDGYKNVAVRLSQDAGPLRLGAFGYDEVLDRKRGIPITLSIIYMEVGRRLGLPLKGVQVRVLLDGKLLPTAEGADEVRLAAAHATRVLNVHFKPVELKAGPHELTLECIEAGLVMRHQSGRDVKSGTWTSWTRLRYSTRAVTPPSMRRTRTNSVLNGSPGS